MSEETKGIEQAELSPQDLDKVAGGAPTFHFTMLPPNPPPPLKIDNSVPDPKLVIKP